MGGGGGGGGGDKLWDGDTLAISRYSFNKKAVTFKLTNKIKLPSKSRVTP